jgi:uroporphyrinogen-III decarboxylase
MNPMTATAAAPAGLRPSALAAVLDRRRPARIPYAPNYWQWFAHQRNQGLLPTELAGCPDQLALIRGLGLDVFSRNLYCDEQRGWFGGLAEAVHDGVECCEREWFDGPDRLLERTYRTRAGDLSERLRYVFAESTLVQEKFLVTDIPRELDALAALLEARRWRFQPDRYEAWRARVGDDGQVIAGELYSPLKLLHLVAGPVETTYLLNDHPERAAELLARHEAAMLDLARQITAAGVRVVMAMDNLDSAFHPPRLVEQCSASFYEQASRLCHASGSLFFIHACGRQRVNLGRIASYGVDGLEGVAFPPLGDVELEEAMRLSGDRMILTGGISAAEFQRLDTRVEVFGYVNDLFRRMKPFAHRFILSASCSTPYTAPWETLLHFRDAWREYGTL